MNRIHLIQANAARLPLTDASVHCVVTSPPYYGLREYDAPDIEYDGWVGQLGLEPTPELFIEHMVGVFREVRRVLRADGQCFVNLGDKRSHDRQWLGIPWRFALAMQADGWRWEDEIVWEKPNALPSSQTNRFTRSHEAILMFNKSKRAFFDIDAVREPQTGNAHPRGNGATPKGAQARQGLNRANNSWQKATAHYVEVPGGRARRTVWSINTKPYTGAHFATYPPDLVEVMVKAGTSERGCCAQCGAPWERVAERWSSWSTTSGERGHPSRYGDSGKGPKGLGFPSIETRMKTLFWRPSCTCNAPGDMQPDDLEVIATPTGGAGGDDPTLRTGRAGLNRPRGLAEGTRYITRYEQRCYAAQLKQSPHRAEMEAEAGTDAFAHYLRSDRSGARPVPSDMLAMWIARGWLEPVTVPDWNPPPVRPCVVLDPFAGTGTTAIVANALGRRVICLDLSPAYLDQAWERTGLAALEAWGHGIPGGENDLSDLPMFRTLGA